jgi:hypothetical protein
MSEITELLDICKRMDERKAPWLEYWQQLSDVLLPNRADFSRANRVAASRTDKIYDGTPRQAARALASTIDGLLKPKTHQWFWITLDNEDLLEIEEIKLWLEDVAERMRNAIYKKSARFTQRSAEVDESLVVLGTGALWIGENQSSTGLLFRSFHLRDYAIEENGEGEVDRFEVDEHLTARQAIQRWGEDKMHPEIRKAAADTKALDKDFCFTQLIMPQDDYEPGRLDARGKRFKSCVIDVKHEHEVSKGGFEEFPVAVPRWDTTPDEIYGRSPGMMALPDAKTLQAMGKTLLIAGQKAVDPPTWAYNDAVVSPIRTFPGGHISLDASVAGQISGAPIGVLDMGKNMPLGLDMQQAVRQQVEAAFFKNLFTLPDDTRLRTATEILARKEEYQRTIGPVFGRLEADYIGHVVERVFNIMYRAGQFPPFPELPDDIEVKLSFQYLSPIQQARKQTELASLGTAFEVLGPLMELDPTIADNIDGDEIVRDLPEAGGWPQRWLKPKDRVEEIRAQRQQASEIAAADPAGQSSSRPRASRAGGWARSRKPVPSRSPRRRFR